MSRTQLILSRIWASLGEPADTLELLDLDGTARLPSAYALADFVSATTAAAYLSIAQLAGLAGPRPRVLLNPRRASLWCKPTLQPIGWSLPPKWDDLSGDYQTADGWLRIHANAPHHKRAATQVLGCADDSRDTVAAAVATWNKDLLESALVEAGACAAAMKTEAEWQAHEQGRAVAQEPLVDRLVLGEGEVDTRPVSPHRPLAGIRVLDLTRILAGPVATRFLAGYGADVLRIDPLDWEEPANETEIMLGKRAARLDLKTAEGLRLLESLLTQADVFIHGYRGDALDRLGLDARRRRQLNPRLIEVSLTAYGWSGPWRHRRGYDSLLQLSAGLADREMKAAGKQKPVGLPVQALDYGTGYLIAAAAVLAILGRKTHGQVEFRRLSLARTAAELAKYPEDEYVEVPPLTAAPGEYSLEELTSWGPAKRLSPPASIEGVPVSWAFPARRFGSDAAAW